MTTATMPIENTQDNALKRFRYLSFFNLFCTLCLITLGGHVHNTGSSLACPDWPLCFGQVLPKMEGEVLIEHSHRLLASLVGFVCILMVYFARPLRENRPQLYKFSIFALLLVIFQGILGGLTVIYRLPPLISTAHLGTSQVFLGLLLYLCLRSRETLYTGLPAFNAKGKKILAAATGLLFIQILIGATVRHTGAGPACGLGPQYWLFCMEAATGGTTLWPEQIQSQFHAFHRYFGILLAFVVVGATIPAIKWAKANGAKMARVFSILAHLFVLVQIKLGMLSVATYIGPVPTTLHLTFAALLFSALLSLNIVTREPELKS